MKLRSDGKKDVARRHEDTKKDGRSEVLRLDIRGTRHRSEICQVRTAEQVWRPAIWLHPTRGARGQAK